MSNTFMKNGLRGFTLIELLVVIAIIGLLATVIATPVQNARKKAKDVKKMAELKAVQSALDQYAEANGEYPATLAALTPQYMQQMSIFASTSSTVRDRFAYVVYSARSQGAIVDTRFGYHLGVHLDVYAEPLKNDSDCIGATDGMTIVPPACVWFNGAAAGIATSYPGWETGMIGTSISADFNGAETPGDTACSAVADCVFDLTGQY